MKIVCKVSESRCTDPLDLGLAALTWWLRLQVVTFIAGKRRRRSLVSNYLEDLEDLTKTVLGADQYHHVKVMW